MEALLYQARYRYRHENGVVLEQISLQHMQVLMFVGMQANWGQG
jgi:hypothetical protein